MPLDRTIQELESRLPDLRHLIADGEMVLATSESAALLADELESLLRRADTVASRLRQLLLGGSLPSLSEPSAAPVAVVPTPELPRQPEPAAPVTAGGSEPATWSEMDDELARIMSIDVETSDEEAEPENNGDEVPPDDRPGGAAVGARIGPQPPLRGPGTERTFAEATEPPRNP